jgi:hypothetical protein
VADARSSMVRLLQTRRPFLFLKSPKDDPSGRAVSGSDLRPLVCWDCGFDSRRKHRCLSVVNVGCCEVQVSAMGRSLVQRSTTERGVYVISKSRQWGVLGPSRAVTTQKKIKNPPTNELRFFTLILTHYRPAGLSYVLTRTLVTFAA